MLFNDLFSNPAYLEQFNYNDMVSLNCPNCDEVFERLQKQVKFNISSTRCEHMYCSRKCQHLHKGLSEEVNCKQCQKPFFRPRSTGQQFCGSSCSATFNNKSKKFGIRRSKLEMYLEQELSKRLDIEIHFNRKDTIGSELDIYFPSLKLAVELNGPVHYRPIYGEEKLQSIQDNDRQKVERCRELNIKLVTFDVSKFSYFKESRAIQYLDTILELVAGAEFESATFGL